MERLLNAASPAGSFSLVWPRLWPPLLLFGLALLTRLPFQSQMLYHWDSVNFALALQQFDVANGQPHAPGYPLYVVLGHLAAFLAGAAQPGYVLLAILGSATAALGLYELGRAMWNQQVGFAAAALLLASPLFWFYGEVALPHTLDAAAVVITALLCWHVHRDSPRLTLALAVWLGLIGGFRQQTLVFMFPLALLVCSRLPLRQLIAAAIVLGLTVLAWALPLFALSGGLERYLAMVAGYSASFNRTTSVFMGASWQGVLHNLDKLFRYTAWGWGLGIVFAVAGLWAARRSWRAWLRDRRVRFLLVWAAPCLGFYSFIHMGQQGLIFVYLPILMLLSALGGFALGPLLGRWLLAACVAISALLFLFAPVYLAGQVKLLALSTIRAQDDLLRAEVAAAQRNLPAGAVLLSDQWRFPQYYLPDVALVPYTTSILLSPGGSLVLTAREQAQLADATALAWYEPTIDRFNRSSEQTVLMGDVEGVALRVLWRAPDERFFVTAEGFGLCQSQAECRP